MNFVITARWNSAFRHPIHQNVLIDIIEIDNTYYTCLQSGLTNSSLESSWRADPNSFCGSTIDTIRNNGDTYNVLSIIKQETPSWVLKPKKHEEEKDGVCKCDFFTLMNQGCPSSRGLKCPSA